jgi:CRISPR-associated endonuclease Csn1
MNKTILGLDLGTNSIGWALVDKKDQKILGMNSRIIPMSQEILGEFDKGNSISQTAARTGFRGTRRLRERHLLRRERLHRVLNVLGFLPQHFSESINKYGKFDKNIEPKLAYKLSLENKHEFIFKNAYNEMLMDFKKHQPQLLINKNNQPANIPYDWTLYYLRKKAIKDKIDKEELAWLLLHFNQKRGYYQLRGEDEDVNNNKLEEFYNLLISDVTIGDKGKKEGEVWYNVILENGWIYRRSSKIPLFDWVGKYRDFIVTTELNEDGSVKTDKDGKEKRSFRAPKEDDWGLRKKKTESDINQSEKTVGEYIYDSLLSMPNQKIKGELVRTIERKYYKSELERIIECQIKYHEELNCNKIYEECINVLYENNEDYKKTIESKDFKYLFVENIIFYQRPLKSKKSEILNCSFEYRKYKEKDGKEVKEYLKCISKSHPLYQEFRLWQWIQNIKIYEREKSINNKILFDVDVTNEFLKSEEDYVLLFDFLNDRKEINQKAFLGFFGKNVNIKKYRWNFIDDDKKSYPCNETRTQIFNRLEKVKNISLDFFNQEIEIALWHILYSVTDKIDTEKALKTFAIKNNLDVDSFVENFIKYPIIKSDYGAYSEKAIKKLLPLLRMGKYWSERSFHPKTIERINKLLNAEFDEAIQNRVREKAINLTDITHFKGLPLWLVSYVVYNRHSEAASIGKWQSPSDLEAYLRKFKQHSLRNPIVEQVITETLRVVNDIWKQYGNGKEDFFEEIHIELGREMKNNAADRKSISENNSKNEATNLRIKALLLEFSKPEYGIEGVRPYSPSQADILKIYEDGVLNSGIEIDDDILKISKSSQPTEKEVLKYKLWLEQKYRSPYTGEIIPLSKLFTSAYEIEHIIPQSIYFDDSFSNKVICESEVNKLKDNQFGFEFISNHGTEKVILNGGKSVTIFSKEQYEEFIKQNYSSNNKGKAKKLLLEDVPEKMIERQLNDTRYISKEIKTLLSNVVRAQKEDDGVTSKNVLSCNGSITSILKQDWGLNDVWNELITPRFERLNHITNSNKFGEWVNKDGKKVFQIQVPLELQKGFNKKRIDHRHHALDALVIACATRNHINYLNNQSALDKTKKKTKEDKQTDRHDLKHLLCFKTKPDSKGNYKWQFKKPWESITQDTKEKLELCIVSFKQNLRVINKSVNYFQKIVNGKKELVKQTKGDNWAIRKPLHKDTVSGLVQLQKIKETSLGYAIDDYKNIANNKSLKLKISQFFDEGKDKKEILKYFKDLNFIWEEKEINKVQVFYFDNEQVASRVSLNDSFDSSKIKTITDTGIQKILLKHLAKYDFIKDGKVIDSPDLAFSPEGIEEMNKNIVELNDGKKHNPINKVRTYEPKGNKFNVGNDSNKKDKYVEAAKGTNLYFAIYEDNNGKRNYETIPLNIVIERLKQGLIPVPEKENNKLLFWLSPNDLVYVPNKEEIENPNLVDFKNLNIEQTNKIYKIVSFTGNRLYAINVNIASPIIDKFEFSLLNKLEFSFNKVSIKEYCKKIKFDILGNIQLVK